MGTYVVAFRSQPDSAPTPEQEQQWGAWFAGLGAAIADMGNRVGTVRTLNSEHGDPASAVLSGYVVIDAADLDEAARLAGGCPGLRDGTSVEVGEVVGA